jgi:hypothetical protein
MIPAGYMAKRVSLRPDWLEVPHIIDVYSVSACQSENFTDYILHWKHNEFWLFNSPQIIKEVAESDSVDLAATTLFYYEVFELECEEGQWRVHKPQAGLHSPNVEMPVNQQLEGFDVVTFWAKSSPECSPLSCNSLAKELNANIHCLFASFDEAKASLDRGAFKEAEPGPYRIFSVSTVDWP